MNDRHPYINQWADKLQQVPLPDAEFCWKQMDKLLETEMPVRKKDRRWMFVFLLLMFFTGICTCPGIWKGNEQLSKKENSSPAKSNSREQKPVESNKPVVKQNNSMPLKKSNAIQEAERISQKPTDKLPLHQDEEPGKAGNRLAKEPVKQKGSIRENTAETKPPGGKIEVVQLISKKRAGRKHANVITRENKNGVIRNAGQDNDRREAKPFNFREQPRHRDSFGITLNKIPAMGSVSGMDSIMRKADSALHEKKRAAIAGSYKGWMVDAGFNHFFTVGAQERSSFNSSGESGAWRDYLPVPRMSYHFNQRFFVQAEAQFNAPQYTRQILLAQSTGDSNMLGQRVRRSVFVKKLFYFNLPVSVHVSPVKNVNLGVGAQYSRLKNAVGVFEERLVVPNGPAALKSSKTASMKTDTAYHLLQTYEWRLLADANYNWRRLSIGLRYNQALNNFVQVKVPGSPFTQARNHSLQLYVRYTLLDFRK